MGGRVQHGQGWLQRPRKKNEGKPDKGIIQSPLVNNPLFSSSSVFSPNLLGGMFRFLSPFRREERKLCKAPCGIGFTENK